METMQIRLDGKLERPMSDKRVIEFENHWFGLHIGEYKNTPFNWNQAKERKNIKKLLEQFDTKNINSKLLFKAADYYFKLKGFEKEKMGHSFGYFFMGIQKYLHAVMPSTTKPRIPKDEIAIPEESKKFDLREHIEKNGEGFIQSLLKQRNFLPNAYYQKARTICFELFGSEKCKPLDSIAEKPDLDRRQELLRQAEILKNKSLQNK